MATMTRYDLEIIILDCGCQVYGDGLIVQCQTHRNLAVFSTMLEFKQHQRLHMSETDNNDYSASYSRRHEALC